MAQFFKDLSIATPYSDRGPYAVSINTSSLTRSAGATIGNSDERVFQFEMLPPDGNENTGLEMLVTPNLPNGGDVVIKYTDVTSGNFIAGYTGDRSSLVLQVGYTGELPTTSVYLLVGGTDTASTARHMSFYNNSASHSYENAFPSAYTPGKPRYVRMRWSTVNNAFYAKGWNYDEAEPSNWVFSVTTGLNILPDRLSLEVPRNNQLFNLHWIAYSDIYTTPAYKTTIPANDTTTYPGGNRNINFTAEDSGGIPITSAPVYLYHQATGMLLDKATSNATTGAVSFSVYTDELCYAVVVDPTNTADRIYNFLNQDT